MVDSLLVLQNHRDETVRDIAAIPPSRLRKTGFYYEPFRKIVGTVSSDITAIEGIINQVEHMQHQDKSQKHASVSRLEGGDGDDLVY